MKYIKVFIGFMLLISLLWLGKLLLNHYMYFSKNYQTEDAYNKWEDFNKGPTQFEAYPDVLKYVESFDHLLAWNAEFDRHISSAFCVL